MSWVFDHGDQRAAKGELLIDCQSHIFASYYKLINCSWVYKLTFRYLKHEPVLSCSTCCYGLSTRKSAWLLRELLNNLLAPYHSPHACTHSCAWLVIVGFGWPVCFFFQVTLRQESLSTWKDLLVTPLVRVTACSSASTALCRHPMNTTCSVVKFTRRMVWSN